MVVRTIRALIGLTGPEQAHLRPPSPLMGPGALFQSSCRSPNLQLSPSYACA